MSVKIISKTCTGPVNIAVIKYWGKRDEKLILPINASLSGTLDQQQLRAKTTVAASAGFTKDRMWLNGQEQSLDNPRLQNVLKEIRRRARKRKSGCEDDLDMLTWRVHICSENNFPTAAGLASSAAGLACLVFSLSKLFNVDGDISDIARQGSGSACRSVYGGFVEWEMGKEKDGSDSVARQVASENHWPEMRVLILVVSADKKHVGSTAGMQTSVKTSPLLKHRAEKIVPERMQAMIEAIQKKDFESFADLTMKDSNQFHSVCLDTYPPISYMTDISHKIVRMVHAINAHFKKSVLAYTFDAGPNACLYLLEDHVPLVLGFINHFFPYDVNNEQYIRGLLSEPQKPEQKLLNDIPINPQPVGALQYIIHTKVGPGPQLLEEEHSLLDVSGMPTSLINA
ncbi:hypothetical protein CAPTEDRAFT_176844 [Capitella teleta]|uniref:Diphosphomevalonate decarboxylase n=1 Tax=Capitella teleta TaxID=283909 RepID=R7U748_CAPTE|nr:hypothetical protein CAPTEDRAFT_176844 [Capitella teleta]|eukprot:ELU01936.1 hypothetical protein CAPTEDRAFT_176844 [Capitella teleta]